MLLSLLQDNPLIFVIVAGVLVLSLTVHEWAHAFTADRLGDPTPRSYGRVTLNPVAHLDPFGTLLLLLVGFGFAKPVPINPYRLGRWGTLWATLAGPMSNVVIAALCAGLMVLIPRETLLGQPLLALGLTYVLSINIVLAVFNMVPIPPLDGSRILGALVPPVRQVFDRIEAQPFSFVFLFALIYLLSGQIRVITSAVRNWVFGLIGI